MAESNPSHLLASMDRLWFQQTILSSEPTSVVSSRTALQSSSSSGSSSCLESSTQWERVQQGDNASTKSSTSSSTSQNDFYNEVEDNVHNNREGRKRLSRTNLISNKNRSQSSSPSIQRPRKSLYLSINKTEKLQKFSSFSTLHDLELEELKGFMDLGFQFEKDQHSPRIMRVIPGLQRRLGGLECNNGYQSCTVDDDLETDDDKKKAGIMKPYLSEAWSIKRPNSPLLRLRMARVSRAGEMKQCLKIWARTVASSMQSD